MMIVQGFVIPVPEGKYDAFLKTAESFDAKLMEWGALEVVECWEEDVPDGKQTDFRRSVAAEAGEKIVFSWVIWPDKATKDAAHEKMMSDPIMEELGEMPFDGKRMIFGDFRPVVTLGR